MMRFISKFLIYDFYICKTTFGIAWNDFKFHEILVSHRKNDISVSPGVIFLTGHMTGQPFNSVNLLVKPRSSQCCQYLTLVGTAFKASTVDRK